MSTFGFRMGTLFVTVNTSRFANYGLKHPKPAQGICCCFADLYRACVVWYCGSGSQRLAFV